MAHTANSMWHPKKKRSSYGKIGETWQAWRGAVWLGEAWLGWARHGGAWQGLAGRGKAGEAINERSKTMVYQYDWKFNLYPGVSAEDAGKHIEKIQNEQGAVTCRNLLDSAKPEDSVIHPCYEWDDGVAAEKYRLSQSKDLLANLVRVSVVSENQEPKTYRAFVNVEENKRFGSGKFLSVDTAMADSEMRQIVLRNALRELMAFQKKYEDLNELEGVFRAISELKQEIA